MKKRFFTKIISLVLTASMSLDIISKVAYAVDSKTDVINDDIVIDNSFENNEEIPAELIGEMIDKRTATSKRFAYSDGSNIVAEYRNAVHFLDKSGKWESIDNTLVYQKNEYGFSGYVNKENDFQLMLPEKSDNERMIEYITPKGSISWSFSEGGNPSVLELLKSEAVSYEQAELVVDNISSGGIYKNISDNVDLEVRINGDEVKENFYINKKMEDYKISYDISTDGFILKLSEDGIINILFENGEKYAEMPAPFMYDADNEFSDNVYYTLENSSKNNYKLSIVADEKWINDKERTFPIIIDPTITKRRNNVSATFVSSKNPDTKYSMSPVLSVGNNPTYENTRSFISLTLPEIDKSDVVVEAKINLTQASHDPTSYSTKKICAYEVTGAWSTSTLTWNNKPTTSSVIFDYSNLDTTDNIKVFDFTNLARKWYNGSTNYGFMLRSNSESTTSTTGTGLVYFPIKDYYPFTASQLPTFDITYRNNKGIENYWSFHSASLGNDNSASINDFSGNLVFVHNDITETGNRMPVSLSHIYNGYNAGNQYRQDTPSSVVLYDNMNFGKGWQINAEETIVCVFGNANRYIYSDSDVTEHYFTRASSSESVFNDEDGLGMKMTIDSSTRDFIIEDKGGNKRIFDVAGYLKKYIDSNNNQAELIYTSGRITSIKDGVNRTITLSYDSNNNLTSVTDPAGRQTTYTYSNGLLTKITAPDSTYTSFTYDSNGMLVTAYCSENKNRLNFTYTQDNIKRVNRFSESYVGTSSTTEGQAVSVEYSFNDFSTTFRTSGKNNVLGDSDDIKTVCRFDRYGKTVSSYSTDDEGKTIYGAVDYSYTPENSGKKNKKILSEASIGTVNPNLLVSGQCESLTGWNVGYLGTNNSSATRSLTTSAKYIGVKSLAVTSTQNISGSTVGYKQSVALDSGTYTISGYIKTTSGTGKGAVIAIADSNGTVKAETKAISGATDTNINDGWQKVTKTFALSSAGNYSVTIGIKEGTGTAYFDCIQLEKGEYCSSVNLIENSSMDSLTSWDTDYPSNVAVSSNGLLGNCISVAGLPTSQRKISQEVKINRGPDETYILSGFAKANSVDIRGNRTFRLRAVVTYADGLQPQTVEAPFLSRTSGWQFASVAIVPNRAMLINKITVYCDYDYNCGTAYFDNISLTKDVAKSYQYDDNGNVVEAVSLTSQKNTYEYNSSNDLVKQNNPSGYSYNYTYDNKHNATSASNENGIKNYVTYDSYGNITNSKISNPGNTLNIVASSTYTSNGNYIASETDSRGKTVSYTYNTNKGLLTKITDPLSHSTAYQYNSNNDRITSVFADTNNNNTRDTNEAYVTYNYSNGRLSSLGHNDFTYSFAYDGFGNILRTSIGSVNLTTNTYAAHNGHLISSTYGNGDTVGYTYDNLGRQIGKTLNGTSAYSWSYDGNGNLNSLVDSINGIEYLYEYDVSGRPVRSYEYRNGTKTLSSQTKYDSQNRVSSQNYVIGSTNHTYTYNYTTKDNLISSVVLPSGKTLSYTYDSLNRPISKSINTTTATTDIYYYLPATGVNTTPLINKITYSDGSSLSYQYDDIGNIARIKDSDNKNQSYKYDALNQLIRENDQISNKTYIYNYNKGGNIVAAITYPYTTSDTLGTPTSIVTYAYSDTNWKDKLTNYNGTSITYDAIGNPLSYRDNMSFTWSNGRQLTTLQKNSSVVNYTYNADGVRIGKSGSKNVTFEVAGNLILSEKSGTQTTYYLYDEKGSPVGLFFGSNTYYYRKNLQGDIIAIVDYAGTKVAEYRYNAWGKLVYLGGSNMSIATNNHLRYRGYYYDEESGFYYLNSRYYDPEIGRFLSPEPNMYDGGFDEGAGLTGYNAYAYCGNNPVLFLDSDGEFAITAGLCTVGLGAALKFLVGALVAGGAVATGVIVADNLQKQNRDTSITSSNTKKLTPIKPPRDPIHHIVAQYDYRARKAQKILEKAGINRFTDPANLVQLPAFYHRRIHTNYYFKYVNLVIGSAWRREGRDGVYKALYTLKMDILCGYLW